MNPSTKDEIKGNLDEVKGKGKEMAGKVTNNPSLESKGTSGSCVIVPIRRCIKSEL